MLTKGVTSHVDILGSAMQAAILRDSVHNHNMANNDTVGYKKYAVSFEESLRNAVMDYRKTGVLDLSKAAPEVSRIHTNLSTRIDGNNVDVHEEETSIYINSAKYDVLASSVMESYSLLNLVYNMR